jgi:hypothetical protein
MFRPLGSMIAIFLPTNLHTFIPVAAILAIASAISAYLLLKISLSPMALARCIKLPPLSNFNLSAIDHLSFSLSPPNPPFPKIPTTNPPQIASRKSTHAGTRSHNVAQFWVVATAITRPSRLGLGGDRCRSASVGCRLAWRGNGRGM